MPDDAAAPPPPPKRRLPWAYLVFSALIIGIFLLFVLAPDVPRGLLGSGVPPRPRELGPPPAVVGEVSGKGLDERELSAALADLGKINLAKPPPPPAKVTRTPVEPKPMVAAKATTVDEDQAARLLADAEAAYRAMDWEKAESLAKQAGKLSAQSAVRSRAGNIAYFAPLLKRVFKELDERDELARNFETHPSLLRLTRGGTEIFAVPIARMDPPYDPVVDNPLGWVEAQRKNGKVLLLVRGAKQFTPSEMDLSGYQVQAADVAGFRQEALKTLQARIARVENDKSVRRDAFVWYELGKFAYRNRLDDYVVRYLERAVDIDPNLGRAVREANAGILFGQMVMHMTNGNKQQAAAFMAMIDRRYKDTEQAKQARLYYDGKRAEMIAAAKEAERKRREEEAARRQARAAAQQAAGETAAAPAAPAQPEEEEDEAIVEEAPGKPVSPDIASARKLRDQGRAILGEAVNMPPSDARNKKYAEAAKILAQAKALYGKYLEKNQNDSEAEAELIETQKMWFTANKMKTL
ncbi:MAG: hypothetical protein N3B15_09405 [Planctomycetota bacterium]|nr:hypothetical protein [Planctomycetota bacterium]